MIIIKIKGGLGNQMFQYAYGRSLAQRLGVSLKLDISSYETDTLRTYGLEPYSLHAEIATHEEVMRVSDTEQPAFIRRIKDIFGMRRYIKYQSELYNPAMMRISDNHYLEGYWQSERYFSEYSDSIRNDFMLRSKSTGRNSEIEACITESMSVSMHVRRGDYVTNVSWEPCSVEYYKQCIHTISLIVEKPTFIIFSDDPDWVRKHIPIEYPFRIVDWNANTPEWDIHLMSMCRHHIISNSSFSWWGAWLNPSPHKKVYAPLHWFVDPNKSTQDLIPKSWIRV